MSMACFWIFRSVLVFGSWKAKRQGTLSTQVLLLQFIVICSSVNMAFKLGVLGD